MGKSTASSPLHTSADESSSALGDVETRKSRRAAANVNERRRMQNINHGFEGLRDFLEVPNKGKLSKSAILRHAVDLIRNLQSENKQLREQTSFMRTLITRQGILNPHSILYPSAEGEDLANLSSIQVNFDSNNNDDAKPVAVSSNKTGTVTKDSQELRWHTRLPNFASSSKRGKHIHSPINREFDSNILSPDFDSLNSSLSEDSTCPVSQFATSTPRLTFPDSPSRNLRSSPRKFSPWNGSITASPPRRLPSSASSVTPNSKHEHASSAFESPSTRSRRFIEHQRRKEQMLLSTPEDVNKLPPRSAKRSLDAIIEAIDHIERS